MQSELDQLSGDVDHIKDQIDALGTLLIALAENQQSDNDSASNAKLRRAIQKARSYFTYPI